MKERNNTATFPWRTKVQASHREKALVERRCATQYRGNGQPVFATYVSDTDWNATTTAYLDGGFTAWAEAGLPIGEHQPTASKAGD
jgi:hypothetical protein